MKKRILITGGAGFLGSHLCDRFIAEGHHVIAMDNLVTGHISNIEHLYHLENFEFYHQDVTDFIHIPGPLDYILHFATLPYQVDFLKMPVQTLKAGSVGLHNCLGLARTKGARILIASSPDVYGNVAVDVVSEEYQGQINQQDPKGIYEQSRQYQEALMMSYHLFHQVETRIARIFNTYGPRMRLQHGEPATSFIGQVLAGQEPTLFGDPASVQSLCYVDDVVEGIYRLLLSDYHLPVNIGSPEVVNLKGLAEELQEITGNRSPIQFRNTSGSTVKEPRPDIAKASEILGWKPAVTHGEGLLKLFQYFRSLPGSLWFVPFRDVIQQEGWSIGKELFLS